MGARLPGLGLLDPFKVDLPQRQTAPKAAEVLTEGFHAQQVILTS